MYMNIKAIALDWGYAYVTKVQIAVCKLDGKNGQDNDMPVVLSAPD